MTPPAATAPAVAPRHSRISAGRPTGSAGQRRQLGSPRAPRRVSGPPRGGAVALPPSRGADDVARALGSAAALSHLLARALGERADRSEWLQRLHRMLAGRLGIVLVAFALIGIVTLQLGLLKLNGGIGRALEHEALLQRENAALSIENSELAAGDRVQLSAARIGMDYVTPGALRSLTADPSSDAVRAAASLRAPLAGSAALGATAEGGSSQTAEAQAGATPGAAAASERTSSEPTAGTTEQPAATARPAGSEQQPAAASQGAGEASNAPSSPQASGTPGAPPEASSAGGTASQAGSAG